MRVLLIVNESKEQARDAALLLGTYFASQGIEYESVRAIDLVYDDDRATHPLLGEKAPAFDFAISLGGDGTILSAADALAGKDIPILGVNFGHMGFLANQSDDGIVAMVAAALAGDVVSDRRMNLDIEVLREAAEGEQADDDGFVSQHFTAFNEVSVTRGASGRLIRFMLDISGVDVVHLRGDGLVVATPTGSTAYALSAGGPIVAPTHRGMVVVPIAPHSLISRAFVTDRNDVVEILLDDDEASREVALFVDGRALVFPTPARRIVVRRAPYDTTLLSYKAESFYNRVAREFF